MRACLFLLVGALGVGPAAAQSMYYGGPSDSMYSPTPMHAAHIELGAGIATDGSDTVAILDATGRISLPLFSSVKAEAEAFGTALSGNSSTTTGYGFIGHFYKDAPTHQIGAFVGTLVIDSNTAYIYGAEAKGYFGPNSLTGQVGYIDPSGSGAWVFSGRFDHYFSPDKKAGLRVSYYVPQSSSSGNIWTATASVENRFTGSPWSVFGSGTYLSGNGQSIWTGRVGARVFFDTPGSTLQQHDMLVPFDASSIASLAR